MSDIYLGQRIETKNLHLFYTTRSEENEPGQNSFLVTLWFRLKNITESTSLTTIKPRLHCIFLNFLSA